MAIEQKQQIHKKKLQSKLANEYKNHRSQLIFVSIYPQNEHEQKNEGKINIAVFSLLLSLSLNMKNSSENHSIENGTNRRYNIGTIQTKTAQRHRHTKRKIENY